MSSKEDDCTHTMTNVTLYLDEPSPSSRNQHGHRGNVHQVTVSCLRLPSTPFVHLRESHFTGSADWTLCYGNYGQQSETELAS
jgi:hypothetical protein